MIYRNERVPDFAFLQKLKRVDEDLYVVFDSLSMRWDIIYRPKTGEGAGQIFHVYRVCKRSDDGRDVGYLPLDDRVITELMRNDLRRRNMDAEEYRKKVCQAEDERYAKMVKEAADYDDYFQRVELRPFEKFLSTL